MTDQPIPPRTTVSARDEKLQAIAAVFGDALAARLANAPQLSPTRRTDSPAADADRVAWQTNRLIQHLRAQVGPTKRPLPDGAAHGPQPHPHSQQRPRATAQKAPPIPALVAGEDLAAEHPAVIAHILRDAPQQIRVAVLRALPGQIARAVIRRLKAA